jgi:hypothetical protein
MSWPKLCCRCGEKNPDKLIEEKYKWQQLLMQTQSGNTTHSTWAYVNARVNICQKCKRIGLIRWWISIVLSVAAFLVSAAWTFGAFGNITLAGLAVLAPAVFYTIFLILLRRKVVRFYAHFYHSSGYVRGFFRSKDYKKEFDALFPSGIYIKK